MNNVRLFCNLSGPGGFRVSLARRVRLPFAPSVHVSLGLEPGSGFRCDELFVEAVMYVVPAAEFHVRVKDLQVGPDRHDVRWLLARGWELALPHGFDSAEAADYDPGVSYVVRVADRFYAVGGGELWVLREQGSELQIVREPREVPA